VLVNTGNTDGKLGALSRPASVNKLETETADDFVLDQTTVLSGATITVWSPPPWRTFPTWKSRFITVSGGFDR